MIHGFQLRFIDFSRLFGGFCMVFAWVLLPFQVAEASRLGMELVFERDAASDLHLIEQMRALAGASPLEQA